MLGLKPEFLVGLWKDDSDQGMLMNSMGKNVVFQVLVGNPNGNIQRTIG